MMMMTMMMIIMIVVVKRKIALGKVRVDVLVQIEFSALDALHAKCADNDLGDGGDDKHGVGGGAGNLKKRKIKLKMKRK